MTNTHTFVICAYGESPFLEACIQSLKAQDYPSDVVLYSSTPNDLIKNLCRQYDIPYVFGVGGGIGRDWNGALAIVQTKYVTIAHQDDLYLPQFSQEVLAAFERHPDSNLVYTDYVEIQDHLLREENLNLKIKTLMLKVMNWFPASRFWRNRVLAFGNPIACPAVTYNLEKLKGFTFSQELKTSLDWFAWYTISQHYPGRFTYISDKLMHHRIHDESETTATIADKTRTKEDLFMYELLWPKWVARQLIKLYEKSQVSNH